MNNIDILITTWPNHPLRFEYFCRTVEALKKNLIAPDCLLTWYAYAEHTGDEKHQWMGGDLWNYCENNGIQLYWNNDQPSLPRLLNRMHRESAADLRLYIQDDWVLLRPLAIAADAGYLLAAQDCAGIRYWANTRYAGSRGPYLRVDRQAPWAYGDNPALWHRRFFEQYGPFEEGGEFGTHEGKMNEGIKSGPLEILALPEMEQSASYFFQHIGNISSLPNETRWPDRDRNQVRGEGREERGEK